MDGDTEDHPGLNDDRSSRWTTLSLELYSSLSFDLGSRERKDAEWSRLVLLGVSQLLTTKWGGRYRGCLRRNLVEISCSMSLFR